MIALFFLFLLVQMEWNIMDLGQRSLKISSDTLILAALGGAWKRLAFCGVEASVVVA